MDNNRFDDLVRGLARSRRSLLGAALAGAATLAVGANAGAAAKRSVGDICRANGDCASGLCGPKDSTGRRRCWCQSVDDCLSGAGMCSACAAGICSQSDACFDGCTGFTPIYPVISVTFTSTSDSSYCTPVVSISGFAGCTSYTAEYWSARSSDGTSNPVRQVDTPLTTTDVSGESETTAGSFLNQNRWIEFRVTLTSGQIVSGWTQVTCPT